MKTTTLQRLGIICFLVFFSQGAFAQILQRDVIASGGDSFSSEAHSLEWTMGEVMIKNFSFGQLTQGFHQPDLQIIDGVTFVKWDYAIKAFPNPFSTAVNIETDYDETLVYKLYSQTGQLLQQLEAKQLKSTMELSDLPSGFYLLAVYVDGQMVKNFKLVKGS